MRASLRDDWLQHIMQYMGGDACSSARMYISYIMWVVLAKELARDSGVEYTALITR